MIDYTQKYKEALNSGNSDALNEVLSQFYKEALPRLPQDVVETFVRNNIDAIIAEADSYGLNDNNPFVVFLNRFIEKRNNIDPFLETTKYNALHNMVARDILKVSQLRDTCPKEQQAGILLNTSLWENNPEDIRWLINTYLWFMNSGWGGLQLVNISDTAIGAGLRSAVDVNDNFEFRDVLRKLCFFTNAIDKYAGTVSYKNINDITEVGADYTSVDNLKTLIADEQKKETPDAGKIKDYEDALKKAQTAVNKDDAYKAFRGEIEKIKDNKYSDISAKINSADLVEAQIKKLDELVRKNDRDVGTGQYRKQQGVDARDQEFESKQKALFGKKVADKLNLDTSKINSKTDIDALAAYLRAYARGELE